MSDSREIEKAVGYNIDEARIRQRILTNTATVTDWATACLLTDRNASSGICELYAHYQDYCCRVGYSPLVRKTWIAAMKLTGFQIQSGAFAGLAIQ